MRHLFSAGEGIEHKQHEKEPAEGPSEQLSRRLLVHGDATRMVTKRCSNLQAPEPASQIPKTRSGKVSLKSRVRKARSQKRKRTVRGARSSAGQHTAAGSGD